MVRASADTDTILTTDLLAEGIHFDLRTATFEDVGYRAASANLSDVAAMGGTPQYALVALAVPERATAQDVHRLYRGFMAACRPHRVALIGGDTSASASGWFVCITLMGSARRGQALLRSGARVGDGLYVTGTLGDARAGLELLHRSRPGETVAGLSGREQRFLIQRHLRPAARVAVGQWLATGGLATAAIDLSDGLSGDLRHLCEESRIGADVVLDDLPFSAPLLAYAKSTGQDPVGMALAGGEDYELLFTVSPKNRARLEGAARRQGIRITRIGIMRARRSGIHGLSRDGTRRPLPVTSYEHFRSRP
jgi:thiamine-monophosphate kinase